MADERRGISEEVALGKQERPEVIAFKDEIAKADGTLLALKRTTKDGKKLYIAARHLTNPWEYYEVDTAPGHYDIERKLKEGSDKNANPDFYGW